MKVDIVHTSKVFLFFVSHPEIIICEKYFQNLFQKINFIGAEKKAAIQISYHNSALLYVFALNFDRNTTNFAFN